VFAVCAGILVADIFSSPVDAVPAEGQLTLADSFLLNAGGCAVNTAGCLRRVGVPVRVIGKVGRDLFGDFVVSDLERLGIDPSGVIRSGTHPTSITFILNVKGQDRRYIHLIGANGDLRADDVDPAVFEDAAAFYVGGFLGMPAFDCAGLARLFRAARERRLKTVLDVIIPAGRGVSIESVAEALPYTDVFLPNEDEARALTGEDSAWAQAAALSRLAPASTVIITRGRQGVIARRGGEVWQVGAYPMDALDESGAGDAFAAGIITGLMGNWPLENMLRFAAAMGASCTRALGCTAGVFTRDEALRFVESTPIEVRALPGSEARIAWQ
jgi:sugar/nucleoside kinase (ribokinase family)